MQNLLLISFLWLLPAQAQTVTCLTVLTGGTREEWIIEARTLMQGLEAKFENQFSTSGFKNYEEFISALRASPDRSIQQALQILDNNQIFPFIHAPDGSEKVFDDRVFDHVPRDPRDIRLRIAKNGILNSHDTKKSRGDPRADIREKAEAGFLGLAENLERYKGLSNKVKPKSGTLYFASTLPKDYAYPARRYGFDGWIPKDSVFNRIGIFPGDTLNQLWLMEKSPLGSWVSHQGNLSDLYIPWKYRYLMVPFIAGGLDRGKVDLPFLKSGWLSQALEYNDHHWWETQTLGPLDLEDIRAFVFTETRPEGEFLKILLQNNIEIYDGTSGDLVRWYP